METQNPDDWRAVFELDINAVRMMREHLNYAIKMWPGAPARPFEEQEFLLKIRDVETEEPKKKGVLGKLKEKVDDKDEQLAILSTFVRLGILVWSGGILTLAYIKLPPALGIPEQKEWWQQGCYWWYQQG